MCKTCTTFSARPSLQNDMDGGVAAALIEEEAEQRACPDLDAHWRLDEAMARAEKAEEVADARRAEIVRLSQDRNDWEGNALDAEDRAEKAERERDEWKDSAIKAMADLERAEQPRPLTADAIESVLHDILPLSTEHLLADDIADIAFDLHAALTGPPPRPEGAAELEAVLSESPLGPEAVRGSLADFLAERGVRVVTEEQP